MHEVRELLRLSAVVAVIAMIAGFLAAGPAAASDTSYEYRFEFVNGEVSVGESRDKVAFITDAGGSDASNPSGMYVHLSCSDSFPGGFGEKDGPDATFDSAWQIDNWSITKFKKGKADKTCGDKADTSGGGTAGAGTAGIPSDGEAFLFRFEFVNGSVSEGVSTEKIGFITDAGGSDASNPTGMYVHLSCSDSFPGGFGEKDGPDATFDSAWQIDNWSITKYKDGEADKTCGDKLPIPPTPSGDPAIDVEMYVDGDDADTPTGPSFMVGETVTLSYLVTNTGLVSLSNVTLIDTELGIVTCPQTTLAVGEDMWCSEAQVMITTDGQQFSAADVTGDAEVGALSAPVPADTTTKMRSYAFTFSNGQVITGFATNNVVFLPNAGGTDLANPTGMEIHVSCSDSFPGGFGEKDGPHPDNDSAWQIASYEIAKSDKGKFEVKCGASFAPVIRTVIDDDPVFYLAVKPNLGIDIEKHVNGEDADVPTGPSLTNGSEATFEYFVTNTGDHTLTNVAVTDSDLGIRNCEATVLAAGQSMVCDAHTQVVTEPGQAASDATVTGVAFGIVVSDLDPVHFLVGGGD